MRVTQGVVSLVVSVLCLASGSAGLAAPAQVWVDDNWTGPETCGGHVWQTDAFATVQAGIDAVADGGTVTVAPGVYPERVTLAKPLTLRGPGAGINPNAPTPEDRYAAAPARLDPTREATLIPPTVDLTFPRGLLITLASDHLTIDGLTLDGHNPALTGGHTSHDIEIHTAGGIGEADGHPEFISISHTVLRNVYTHGIAFENYAPGYNPPFPSRGIVLLNNRIDNIPGTIARGIEVADFVAPPPPGTMGRGIRLHFDVYALVAGNVITRTAVGISASAYRNQALPFTLTDNTIRATVTGIAVSDFHAGGKQRTEGVVQRNWIELLPTDTGAGQQGITLLRLRQPSELLVSDNTIIGGETGILIWDVWTRENTFAIQRCVIRDVQYGIRFTNVCDGVVATNPLDGTVQLQDVRIESARAVGILVEDDAQAPTTLTLQVSGGTTVIGGAVGALVRGGRAQLTFAGGTPSVAFQGQTTAYLVLEGNGATYPGTLDAATVRFDGAAGDALSGAARARLDAMITDAQDNPHLGAVTF